MLENTLLSHDKMILFLLKNMRHIPASLQNLLEDPSVLKVGVALSEDTNALSRHAPGLTVRGLVDLAPLFQRPVVIGLAICGALLATLGNFLLKKDSSINPSVGRVVVRLGYAITGISVAIFVTAGLLGY